MNRRKFFSFLPIAPAAMMVEGAKAEAESMAPEGNGISITLQGQKNPKPIEGPGYRFMQSDPDPDRRLTMSVGQDGRLWLKTNDGQWQRVMVENG